MTSKPLKSRRIAASLADASREVNRAATDLHHLNLGPGADLVAQWQADGLELPDLPAMRRYRLDRVRRQMKKMQYDGVLLMDPLNIRYATDSTNMQVWVMHNAARYCWVGMDGSCIVWEFNECEFLDAHNPAITEIRSAIGSTYFLAGPRWAEAANRFADEIIDVITTHAGANAKIAVDQCHAIGYQRLAQAGIEVGNGQELMELARVIKGPDEIRAMRCAVHACEASMAEMLRPSTSFRQLTFDSHQPPHSEYRRYCCQFHGVGQCDEFPEIYWPEQWKEWGYDGELEPNMVLTVESFVGPRSGGEGVKLENQVLITHSGPELLTHFPISLN